MILKVSALESVAFHLRPHKVTKVDSLVIGFTARLKSKSIFYIFFLKCAHQI